MKMRNISLLLTECQVACLHELVRKGMYASRSAGIRMAVDDLIKRELTVEERHRLARGAVKV